MAAFLHIHQEKKYNIRRDISPCSSKKLLRFERESVNFLTEYFLPDTDETRGGALSSLQKMSLFLRYVADPGYQSGVGQDFGIHYSTVCKTVGFVANRITEKACDWIKFPTSAVEIQEAKEKWSSRFRIPSVIGALDCTHIQIKKPGQFGDYYINRKGFASINVQVTCDANEIFTSIDAQWAGSTHDSRIFKQSSIYQTLSRLNGSACLLGDRGYGITPWVLTPYAAPNTREERNYNNIHSSERVIIERCFGQLKQRFPILGNRVHVSLDKVPKIIICCAVLHNIAKHLNDEFHIPDEELAPLPLMPVEEYNAELEDGPDARLRARGQQKLQKHLQFISNHYV